MFDCVIILVLLGCHRGDKRSYKGVALLLHYLFDDEIGAFQDERTSGPNALRPSWG
jgi:hypothetical protein